MSDLGDNLSLDMLSGEDTSLNLDEIVLGDSNEGKQTPPDKPEEKEKQKGTSDPTKSGESVAGEEGKTKAPEEKGQTGSSSPDSQLSQIYSSLTSQLIKDGVLSNLDKDASIEDFAGLKSAIMKEIRNGISDSERAYQEALEKGVPQDRYVSHERTMSQLNSITPDLLAEENNAKLRRDIIAQDFLNRGYTKEDADEFAKRSVDLGADVEDSKKALDRIKHFTQQEFDRELAEAESAKNQVNDDIKSFIDKTDEIINGIKVEKGIKERLFAQITTPIARNRDQEMVSKYGKALSDEPIKMKVITEYLFMLTDGFNDFSRITSAIETTKTKELDDVLRSNASALNQNMGVSGKGSDDNETFSFDDYQIDA